MYVVSKNLPNKVNKNNIFFFFCKFYFYQLVFQHCPFLRDYVHNLDTILSRWRGYKLSVPTYGAVLIDPTYEHVLLVRGFYNRESWGFPKGKVQENESPLKCAIREVRFFLFSLIRFWENNYLGYGRSRL
jgi:hypothetical protein